jgi:transcriptional regulator with XRE-family HTH domain
MKTKHTTARKTHIPRYSEEFERKVQQRLAELSIEQDVITLREGLGLTQSQLAEIAGVSQPYIAKLESGRAVNIELKTLVRVATALDAHVDAKIAKIPMTTRPPEKSRKARSLAASAGRH